MRAARIVSLVLFTLLSSLPLVAQLGINPAYPDSGVPLTAYARKFNLVPKPPLPQMQWSQDRAFATKTQVKSREFAAPLEMVSRLRRPISDDSVCYTARTYLYARAGRHSDVTMPVGYRVCTPSAKFQVKSADLSRR